MITAVKLQVKVKADTMHKKIPGKKRVIKIISKEANNKKRKWRKMAKEKCIKYVQKIDKNKWDNWKKK